MRTFVAAVAVSLGAFAVSLPSFAADKADDCVVVYRNESASGLDFELQNNCDKRLTCALEWTLSCENASGKTTSSAKRAKSFGVNASEKHNENASAATCKDGWRIDDVSWSCKE